MKSVESISKHSCFYKCLIVHILCNAFACYNFIMLGVIMATLGDEVILFTRVQLSSWPLLLLSKRFRSWAIYHISNALSIRVTFREKKKGCSKPFIYSTLFSFRWTYAEICSQTFILVLLCFYICSPCFRWNQLYTKFSLITISMLPFMEPVL